MNHSKIERFIDELEARLAPKDIHIVGCDQAECEQRLAELKRRPGFDHGARVHLIFTGVPRSDRYAGANHFTGTVLPDEPRAD